jgi:hypothetical protein
MIGHLVVIFLNDLDQSLGEEAGFQNEFPGALLHFLILNKMLHSLRTGNGSDLSLSASLLEDKIEVMVTAGVSCMYSFP